MAKDRPPSQAWRAFLRNHAKDLIALDFFTVPTATFRVLFVLVVLRHDRRRLVHFNVTEHPTAGWTARQLIEACGLEATPVARSAVLLLHVSATRRAGRGRERRALHAWRAALLPRRSRGPLLAGMALPIPPSP